MLPVIISFKVAHIFAIITLHIESCSLKCSHRWSGESNFDLKALSPLKEHVKIAIEMNRY